MHRSKKPFDCRPKGLAASTFPPPKEWDEALWPNLFHWNELDKRGHFAAFEQPKLFVEEMRNAFKSRRG